MSCLMCERGLFVGAHLHRTPAPSEPKTLTLATYPGIGPKATFMTSAEIVRALLEAKR